MFERSEPKLVYRKGTELPVCILYKSKRIQNNVQHRFLNKIIIDEFSINIKTNQLFSKIQIDWMFDQN